MKNEHSDLESDAVKDTPDLELDELKSEVWSGFTMSQRRFFIVPEFKRKSRVRTIFRDVSARELEEILGRIQEVLAEKKAEEAKRDEEDSQRMERASKILKEMDEQGVDLNTLQELMAQPPENTSSGAKVRYIKDGVPWSGMGRRPEAFKGLSDLDLERFRR